MERIEKEFSVLFSDEKSPYFQVDDARRLAFPFQQLKGKASLQKSIVECLFAGNSQIDLTFLKSYKTSSGKHFKRFEKQSLHQAICIQNWREHVVLKQEDEPRLIYVTIQHIKALEVLAYSKSIARGKQSSFIGFYNGHYLLTVDDDEFVVISRNKEAMEPVRDLIRNTV